MSLRTGYVKSIGEVKTFGVPVQGQGSRSWVVDLHVLAGRGVLPIEKD